MRTESIIRVALPEAPLVSSVLLYLVTKSGRYLNGSQACHLVASGQVRLDGAVERRLNHVISDGMHVIEVYGRIQPFEVLPTLFET